MSTLALCIPAYNAASTLPRLLTSANNQAIPFDEIWVYNDCSTDDTATVAAQYGAKVVSGSVNIGCSRGKNILTEHTNCDWIHFHDADDDLTPDFTTRVHQWINSNGADYEVLLLNINYTDSETGQVMGNFNVNAEALHADPLKYVIDNKIVNFGVYKTSAFKKAGCFDTDEKILYNEDSALHHRLARDGQRFDYLPQITCIIYRYAKSMSAGNLDKCSRAAFHVFEKTAATDGDKYPYELAKQLWKCATISASFQDYEYVTKALDLSKKLGYRTVKQNSSLVDLVAQLSPFLSIWLREKLIRLLKPQLRKTS